MLGSDRFSFETPNVIDPGDLPPSRPRRDSDVLRSTSSLGVFDRRSTCASSNSDSSSGEDGAPAVNDVEYQEARESSARLLRDIGDLELTPSFEEKGNSFHYDSDEEQRGADRFSSSLPSVEEARTYAASLLVDADRRSPRSLSDSFNFKKSEMVPLAFDRTVKVELPGTTRPKSWKSKHLVRKRIMSVATKACAVAFLLVVALTAGLLLVKNGKSHSQSAGDLSFPPMDANTTRWQDLVDFLVDNGISEPEALANITSPQFYAARWMALEDGLQYDIPESLEMDTQNLVQRYALVVLYYSLNGAGWSQQFKFLSNEHECAWYTPLKVDTYVSGEDYAFGVTCNNKLQVINLYLPENKLRGTLPPEIGLLRKLDLLAFPLNEISGTIPNEIFRLTDLFYFDLKYNHLTGTIPYDMGNLENLEVLGLSNNNLQGTVPNGFGTLARLKTLAIDDNSFTGSLDFALYLNNLEFFYADRNMLSSTLDDNFLVNLERLRELDLSTNQLISQSTFPLHLLQHATLEVLDLSTNGITASFPDTVTENRVMKYLSLKNNQMQGSVTAHSLASLVKLTHLDISQNHLTGRLPDTMKAMSQLTYLAAGFNNFTAGEVPNLIYKLSNLHELSLPKSNMIGAIPEYINVMSNMVFLDLSFNSLGSSIPSEILQLPQLAYLLLNNNMLTGSIPSYTPGSNNLRIFTLHKNPDLIGDVTHVCTESSQISLMAVDCNSQLQCSSSCCKSCCSQTDNMCYAQELHQYLTTTESSWEFGYERASYSFDPAILAESGVVSTITEIDYP